MVACDEDLFLFYRDLKVWVVYGPPINMFLFKKKKICTYIRLTCIIYIVYVVIINNVIVRPAWRYLLYAYS